MLPMRTRNPPATASSQKPHRPVKERNCILHAPVWTVPFVLAVLVLALLQLPSSQKALDSSLSSRLTWVSRRLSNDRPSRRLSPIISEEPAHAKQQELQRSLDRKSLRTLRSTIECMEPEGGEPNQRVCVFEDLVLYGGRLLFVSTDVNMTLPDIKISHKPKFEGDDLFRAEVVPQARLPFSWENSTVEVLPLVGMFHQQHYSNFYHMLSEVAPSVHFIMCKYLQDCTYSPNSSTHLLWIQDWNPGMPQYTMLDTIAETFSCLSPHPVLTKDDVRWQNKVVILRRAVAGISNQIRVFHEWREEHKALYREPPPDQMLGWRQRVADCFGFDFTKARAPTDPLRILFVNRHYREGRHIVNQAELAHMIKKLPELEAFPSVDIRMHYLNGDDRLRDQAEHFWNTSLLIWPHGATMALTFFLPVGAQAIEVIPWVEEEKANQADWVQAIRDAFALDIGLYAVQNKERRRYMYKHDELVDHPNYKGATADQKVALLERGECPPGVDNFTCPFWWNHWQSVVNLDWATLEPAVKEALAQLARQRGTGGQGRGWGGAGPAAAVAVQ